MLFGLDDKDSEPKYVTLTEQLSHADGRDEADIGQPDHHHHHQQQQQQQQQRDDDDEGKEAESRKQHKSPRPSRDDIPATSPISPPPAPSPSRSLPTCVVDPFSTWKSAWDTAMMLAILYSAFSVPIRLAFDLPEQGLAFAVDVAVSLGFMCDVALSFLTAFETTTGTSTPSLETSHRKIASRYLRGWFWIDAPSAIPVELLELAMYHAVAAVPAAAASPLASPAPPPPLSSSLATLRVLRVFRLVRLLRLLRIDHYMARLEEVSAKGRPRLPAHCVMVPPLYS